MNFPVNAKKAAQSVARLLEQSHGPADYLRIIKLIYLADRESIRLRGLPIVGGRYFSMRRGPVISEVMNFVGARNAPDWKHLISPRHGNEIRLQGKPTFEALSESELEILDNAVSAHVARTTDELVEWCHANCPEYAEVKSGRKPIAVEDILAAVGKKPKAIKAVVHEAAALAELDAMLS